MGREGQSFAANTGTGGKRGGRVRAPRRQAAAQSAPPSIFCRFHLCAISSSLRLGAAAVSSCAGARSRGQPGKVCAFPRKPTITVQAEHNEPLKAWTRSCGDARCQRASGERRCSALPPPTTPHLRIHPDAHTQHTRPPTPPAPNPPPGTHHPRAPPHREDVVIVLLHAARLAAVVEHDGALALDAPRHLALHCRHRALPLLRWPAGPGRQGGVGGGLGAGMSHSESCHRRQASGTLPWGVRQPGRRQHTPRPQSLVAAARAARQLQPRTAASSPPPPRPAPQPRSPSPPGAHREVQPCSKARHASSSSTASSLASGWPSRRPRNARSYTRRARVSRSAADGR